MVSGGGGKINSSSYFAAVSNESKELSLLIVEDDPIIAANVARQVRKFGYTVAAKLRSGELAIEYIRDNPPDLVLMDVQLEGQLNGIETAEQIQRLHPLPLIYLTANTDEATRRAARQTAPAAFLSKPFRSQDLQSAIELALDNFQRDRNEQPPAESTPPLPQEETAFLLRDRFFVKEKRRLVRLLVEDITHASAEDYFCHLFTTERSFILSLSLKNLETALADRPEFVRVHRSHLVNLLHITEVGELRIHLGKEVIPVSRAGREGLVERLRRL